MFLRSRKNRQENKDRMKIEEKAMVRNISALKASVIKKLDELEKSALLELQTVSQDSIGQMAVLYLKFLYQKTNVLVVCRLS
jgi:gamma-glutamylcyclotransferase (GGCT)/AIG2-like uncharacterized protein YtfP